MLANTITLVDDSAVNHSYDLVSREGMNSARRETTVASKLASVMEIKNTVDLSSSDPNRHLIRFGWNEEDATTGELYPCSVHCVITRHKSATDAALLERLAQLADFIADSTLVNDVLVGGN